MANVAFESVPGFFVTGNLFRPLEVKGPCPVVLCPHGHFPNGRYEPDQQQLCATLARMGAVVFSYSMIGYNDSTQVPHHTPCAFTLQLWNSMRAVDFVSSLEGVHAKRIAVTVRRAAGRNRSCSRRSIPAWPSPARWSWFPRTSTAAACARAGCRCIAALATLPTTPRSPPCSAPRPLLVVSDGKDWTKDVPTREMPYLKSVYRLFAAEAKVENVHLAGEGHDYGPSKRQAVYAFLARHLGLAAKPVTKTDE